MSHFNEHTLEMAIMELFEQQGYSYKSSETMPLVQYCFDLTTSANRRKVGCTVGIGYVGNTDIPHNIK